MGAFVVYGSGCWTRTSDPLNSQRYTTLTRERKPHFPRDIRDIRVSCDSCTPPKLPPNANRRHAPDTPTCHRAAFEYHQGSGLFEPRAHPSLLTSICLATGSRMDGARRCERLAKRHFTIQRTAAVGAFVIFGGLPWSSSGGIKPPDVLSKTHRESGPASRGLSAEVLANAN